MDRKAVVQYLHSLRMAGLTDLPRCTDQVAERIQASIASFRQQSSTSSADVSPESPLPSKNRAAETDATDSPTQVVSDLKNAMGTESQPASSDSVTGLDHAEALQILNQQVRDCRLCTDLVSNRTQTVFGVGNPRAKLCFMGEAPGADEDRLGEPFVGEAGRLLNRIMAACNLERSDIYILNVIKCRPPENRNPSNTECQNCRPFWEEQLKIIQPEFICCLGGIAAKNLLDTELSVGRLREKIHRYQDSKVLVTYHPAYLLRNPDAKRLVWNDMKFLMREMGQPVDQ